MINIFLGSAENRLSSEEPFKCLKFSYCHGAAMLFSFLILSFVLCVFISCEYYKLKTGVPTVVSFPSAQKKIVDILKAKIPNNSSSYRIVDLGSGGGQLCRRIASAYPKAEVLGIEISFLPWLRSFLVQKLMGPANLQYKRIDFWHFDCSNIDVVVLFLTGNILDRMGKKLHQELKPGTYVIANDERLGDGWEPIDIIDNPVFWVFYSKIYVYRQS